MTCCAIARQMVKKPEIVLTLSSMAKNKKHLSFFFFFFLALAFATAEAELLYIYTRFYLYKISCGLRLGVAFMNLSCVPPPRRSLFFSVVGLYKTPLEIL